MSKSGVENPTFEVEIPPNFEKEPEVCYKICQVIIFAFVKSRLLPIKIVACSKKNNKGSWLSSMVSVLALGARERCSNLAPRAKKICAFFVPSNLVTI